MAPMKKEKITIHDIAEKLNITASTVSRALKDHPRISEETKKAVLKVAQKLNYQPNHIAAALRNGRSKILGIIVPNVDRSFFSSVVFGIEEVANKAGYNVMICQSHEDPNKEADTVEALLNAQVDGVIASFAKGTENFEHFLKIKGRGVPLVIFDRANDELGVSHVVTDDYLGAYKAVEHLIQQGCQRIAHFTGSNKVSIYRERFRGYKEALLKYNIPFDEELVMETNLQLEDGQKSMLRLLKLANPVDGVFSSSALAAMGALQVCKNNSISVPERVAIVGFSNEKFALFSDPTLTSVEQHSLEMGNTAAQLFFEQLNAKASGKKFIPQKIVLTPTLIIRESSMKSGKKK
jgi:LacI family transcriptional regulator